MIKNWLTLSGRTFRHLFDARRTRAPIVFFDRRWDHHGRHSGYLINEGIGPALPSCPLRVLPYPLSQFVGRRASDPRWEKRLLFQLLLQVGEAGVVHVVDGDFDAWVYERRAPWLRTRFTATFHQTVDKLPAIAAPLRPGMLDAIICVSRNQIPILEHLVPRGRCIFIPHGVDSDFFRPTSAAPKRQVALAVGVHRRDFATLVETAKIIKARCPKVTVRWVGPAEFVDQIEPGHLEISTSVDDEGLRDAYQEATCLLLPLHEATANNAVLESMACGRPAVITDLPAVRDYSNDDAAFFCPRADAEAHAEATLRLLADGSLAARMGRAAYERSREFSWSAVRAQVSALLGEVAYAEGSHPAQR